jgi:hypothetical protein
MKKINLVLILLVLTNVFTAFSYFNLNSEYEESRNEIENLNQTVNENSQLISELSQLETDLTKDNKLLTTELETWKRKYTESKEQLEIKESSLTSTCHVHTLYEVLSIEETSEPWQNFEAKVFTPYDGGQSPVTMYYGSTNQVIDGLKVGDKIYFKASYDLALPNDEIQRDSYKSLMYSLLNDSIMSTNVTEMKRLSEEEFDNGRYMLQFDGFSNGRLECDNN